MLYKLALLALTCSTVSACVKPLEAFETFDPGQAAYIQQAGPNTIVGQAFLRQRGGGVVTCAGESVSLIPATRFSSERIGFLYGTTETAARGNLMRRLSPAPSDYQRYMRRSQCDAEGRFLFENTPDGDYFITTDVIWVVGDDMEGGPVMSPVSVRGGENRRLIIAP